MKKHELELLLELVCDKQNDLINHKMWESKKYKDLEHIKVNLKRKIMKHRKELK